MKISSKRQVSIPKKVMDALRLNPGDEVDFEIHGETAVMLPIKTVRVPRDQAWFWTEEWQKKEREADEDLSQGRYRDFESIEGFMKELRGED